MYRTNLLSHTQDENQVANRWHVERSKSGSSKTNSSTVIIVWKLSSMQQKNHWEKNDRSTRSKTARPRWLRFEIKVISGWIQYSLLESLAMGSPDYSRVLLSIQTRQPEKENQWWYYDVSESPKNSHFLPIQKMNMVNSHTTMVQVEDGHLEMVRNTIQFFESPRKKKSPRSNYYYYFAGILFE